jgi:hypothetical protein
MPSTPRIRWSSAQRDALRDSKEEFRAFLDEIDYEAGESRRDMHGKQMKSVIRVRDDLVERLMSRTDSAGNDLFSVEITQVWAFYSSNVEQLTKTSQSVTQSLDNWLNNTYLKANAKPALTLTQAKTANINMLRNQEGPNGKNVFKDMNYAQIQALAPSMVVQGDNPGGRFNAAWTSLWKECQDKSHYERLAAMDKR